MSAIFFSSILQEHIHQTDFPFKFRHFTVKPTQKSIATPYKSKNCSRRYFRPPKMRPQILPQKVLWNIIRMRMFTQNDQKHAPKIEVKISQPQPQQHQDSEATSLAPMAALPVRASPAVRCRRAAGRGRWARRRRSGAESCIQPLYSCEPAPWIGMDRAGIGAVAPVGYPSAVSGKWWSDWSWFIV